MRHLLILLTAFLALAFTGSLADEDASKGWCCKKGKCCGDKCYEDWWWKIKTCKHTVHTCKCEDPPDDKPVCEQPADPGPCKGRFIRWYYNAKKGKCLKFIYGGCKGNENNFRSKDKCLKKCSKDDGGDDGKDCCKKGYHCCGRRCRYGRKKPWWCGKSKCCKKPHKRCLKHRHCRWGRKKYCCRYKCVTRRQAWKKGCI